MPLSLDPGKVRRLDTAVRAHILQKSGQPFVAFNHPWVQDEELTYKLEARRAGIAALQLSRWSKWRPGDGRILNCVRAACHPGVSRNLILHRYGPYAVLREHAPDRLRRVEHALRDFLAGDLDYEHFGPRFDAFVAFLKSEKLAPRWPLLAYLAFLAAPERYVPVLPTEFDRILAYFELDTRLTRHLGWAAYRTFLDVGAALREQLPQYGAAISMIEVHSYMWIARRVVGPASAPSAQPVAAPSLADELRRRLEAAERREKIGLVGEEFVVCAEKQRLHAAQRPDLAECVDWVAARGETPGYDILSFDNDGTPRRIEVKSTMRQRGEPDAFFLSENERAAASEDERWTLVRVWDALGKPESEDVGNLIRSTSTAWTICPTTWRVTPAASTT